MDAKILGELKEALLKEKAELEKNISPLAHPVDRKTGDYETSFDDVGSDMDDNATEMEEFADNLPVEVTLERKLKDTIEALHKMETGEYGKCEVCHKDIELTRLNINPAAKTCLGCSRK